MAAIVVVDSNAAALDLIEQALRDAGHIVLVTSSALEAHAVASAVQVDLVIATPSDLEGFRSLSHPPRLLAVVDADEAGNEPALRRPFTLPELLDAVAGVVV